MEDFSISGYVKPIRHKGDVIKNTSKYFEKTGKKEITSKELQTFFEENGFLSNSLFYLKLDKKGNKLNQILRGSGYFIGEIKYNKTYKRRLMHWKIV